MQSFFYYLLFFTCSFLNFTAQNIEQIRLKKEGSQFLFFQKDSLSNKIIPKKTDVFYLILSDSLKENIYIETENLQITQLKNDSLVILKHVPGINYLNIYVLEEEHLDSNPKEKKLKMLTLINGANDLQINTLKVSFINKFTKKAFAEFVYFANTN